MIILCILLIFAIIVFWSSSMRARSVALDYGQRLCEKRGWNFLDDSVVLNQLSLKRLEGRFHWLRIYSFEYTFESDARLKHDIILHGLDVIEPEPSNIVQFPISRL
jgi:hypothetical protein